MKIALAQLNPTIGAFDSNCSKIESYWLEASRQGCDLMITPELAVSGYSPMDLLTNQRFCLKQDAAIERLVTFSKQCSAELLLGCFLPSQASSGKPLVNAALWIADGRVIVRKEKTLLPSYDVFEETRFFEPSMQSNHVTERHQRRWSIAICEDIWNSKTYDHGTYARDPLSDHQKESPDLTIALNASPYTVDKSARRLKRAREIVSQTKKPFIYVNQTCLVDNVLFDGKSFVLNGQGKIVHQLPAFEECLFCFDESSLEVASNSTSQENTSLDATPEAEMCNALIFGIREYFQKTKQRSIVIGLSGGVDSAVVAALAVKAVGAKNVHGVALPGPFNQPISLEDAQALAKNLGIHFHVSEIESILKAASSIAGQKIENLKQLVAYENMQSRIRGLLLMTYANAINAIVLNTSNKSEIATGYCTLYGDSIGALAPIGDLLKTQVYAIARQLNQENHIIPERILTRKPSAELRPDQTDQDTLPEYEILDAIIDGAVVHQLSASEIARKIRQDESFVAKWMLHIDAAEFKRRQLPFCLHVSQRAFDSGRRVPIMRHLSVKEY